LPGRLLGVPLDDDPVPRVVPENERRGESATWREGQRDARVRVGSLDVLADRRFMAGLLELGHGRVEDGADHGPQPLATLPATRLFLERLVCRVDFGRALGVRLEQRSQPGRVRLSHGVVRVRVPAPVYLVGTR